MGGSNPLHIAVLAGGYSGEADVSRRSAAMVMEHVDRTRFVPYLVHIDPDNWWVEHPDPSERTPVDFGLQTQGRHHRTSRFGLCDGAWHSR